MFKMLKIFKRYVFIFFLSKKNIVVFVLWLLFCLYEIIEIPRDWVMLKTKQVLDKSEDLISLFDKLDKEIYSLIDIRNELNGKIEKIIVERKRISEHKRRMELLKELKFLKMEYVKNDELLKSKEKELDELKEKYYALKEKLKKYKYEAYENTNSSMLTDTSLKEFKKKVELVKIGYNDALLKAQLFIFIPIVLICVILLVYSVIRYLHLRKLSEFHNEMKELFVN